MIEAIATVVATKPGMVSVEYKRSSASKEDSMTHVIVTVTAVITFFIGLGFSTWSRPNQTTKDLALIPIGISLLTIFIVIATRPIGNKNK